MKKERVGYFGGTFDPPHLGHIILAAESQFHLDLDRYYWIITPDPPHKSDRPVTPVEHRLEMLNLIVEELGTFQISDVDLRRDPPHFAADTVAILKKENPAAELVYIIGEDSLKDLPDWHEPGRFLAIIDQLGIIPRTNLAADLEGIELTLPGLREKTVFLPELLMDISSSLIRSRVREGSPYEHFLTGAVAEYIRLNDLYLSG